MPDARGDINARPHLGAARGAGHPAVRGGHCGASGFLLKSLSRTQRARYAR